jgi:hypothetical protein
LACGTNGSLVVLGCETCDRSYLKNRIFVRDQGEAEDQSAGILKYVEDLRRGHNADIGRKDFFEMTYSDYTGQTILVKPERPIAELTDLMLAKRNEGEYLFLNRMTV